MNYQLKWLYAIIATVAGIIAWFITHNVAIVAAVFAALLMPMWWSFYTQYAKDNPKRYWFKRKLFGWGWTPVTWQGWLVTVLYLILITGLVLSREEAIPGNPESGSNFLVHGLPIILLTSLFIVIAYKKGEKPRWQWGSRRDG